VSSKKVAGIVLLWLAAGIISTSLIAQTRPVELVEGMAYTIKTKSPAQNAAVGEFAQYQAVMKTKGLTISSIYLGTKTLPMEKLKKDYPSLARMILVTPVGETRQWVLSEQHQPPDIYRMPGPFTLDLKVIASPNPLKAPENVNAPPANAIRTASGLRYVVLKKGGKTTKPNLKSTVVIDYSGWDSRGRLFDSSVKRGERASFPLSGLIAGWQEGVPLMSPGDTYRFWIPGHLAYDGSPSPDTPKGQLVFDITLYSFSD
jgi:hypothetical protein